MNIFVGDEGLFSEGDAAVENRLAYSLLGDIPVVAGADGTLCCIVVVVVVVDAEGVSNDVLSVEDRVEATESVSKYWNDFSLIVSDA